jgi:integrase
LSCEIEILDGDFADLEKSQKDDLRTSLLHICCTKVRVPDVATVYTKKTPSGSKLFYIRFKDVDGEWKDRPSHCPTKADAKRLAAKGDMRVADGLPFFIADEEKANPTFGDLHDKFLKVQNNRSKKDDVSRMRCHVLPKWHDVQISKITLQAVMLWIDDMRAGDSPVAEKAHAKKAGRKPKKKLSAATMRHNINLLSRFFGWAIERGFAELNPVRHVPMGKRPRPASKAVDRPWIEDDDVVVKVMKALAPPFDLMFYLGNRSGLRPGETWGLRMSDFGFLDEGAIRVRFSYDGPLKEDKYKEGKLKWVPAPDDCKEHLALWLKKRKLAGAKDEDYVFPAEPTFDSGKQRLEHAWKTAAKAVGLWFERANKATGKSEETLMTFYEATRHSFTSRNLKNGASLDEVSGALGHSSPVVTRRYYDHFVRKSFSVGLRQGLAKK